MPTEQLDEDNDRDYARRYEAEADDELHNRDWREYATMRAFGPGLGSILVGLIGVLIGIVMCTYLVGMYRTMFDSQREQIENRTGISEQQKQKMLAVQKGMTDAILVGVPIYGVFTVGLSLLTMLSGVLMMKCKARWFCITMAVVNLIPCLAIWFYTLPLSIWMLVVLNNAEVIAKMRGLRSPDEV
jgi:hypothetical protein